MAGLFEIHLTVAAADADRLAAFAERHGVKVVHILLDRGRRPAQPMLSLRTSGSLDDAMEVARRWQGTLHDERLPVTRLKVEAAPGNTGVPDDDSRPVQPDDRYFEHHVKLVLSDANEHRLVALTELAAPYNARLSRNARRERDDGRHERFITQRCHGVGRTSARRCLDALVADLRAGGHEIASVEAEYVVHDSCLSLDDGWL
ncbi:hypothetical protein DLE60_34565 [Micromonospora globispora]|uniref:Uncharacterized protein n=1 Tax=Micromonospora globispora TaxID=1450148 RepID=A0A317K2G5_9ACTN|nr:hypothetical protein DLJ46_17795 [Micromonospora globispora]PWU48124.1 hypothetical protein DLE60_34565 [Micromonospora globispora]